MNVNYVIIQFANFLNKSFDRIIELTGKIENENKNIILADKIENGFLQFVWEIVVETQLCKEGRTLEAYGDGADFYEKSSRVLYPDRNADNGIFVFVVNGLDHFSKEIVIESKFDFIKLVSYDGKYFAIKPPFDFVLCEDDFGHQHLFKLNEVDFLFTDL